jgi:enoyl-CoA hydratase
MDMVLTEITNGIAVVTINRPQNLNALNSEVVTALENSLRDVEQNADVKVVVITGAGEKAFVAGGDIKEMTSMDSAAARAFSQRGHRLIAFMEQMKKPIIAAVNGYALGGGLELALACDFIYASEKAKLAGHRTCRGSSVPTGRRNSSSAANNLPDNKRATGVLSTRSHPRKN